MFSLVVTIISIALVAVLALATIWYGGEVFISQRAQAASATLVSQSEQIYAASHFYYLDNQAWPANVAVLAAGGKYLTTAPVPPSSAYMKVSRAFELISSAYAEEAAPSGEAPLPALKRPVADYLGTASWLTSDFGVPEGDVAILQLQLQSLYQVKPGLATLALQLMEREVAVQAAGNPSLMDYQWPAAEAQSSNKRYLQIPGKVSEETCRAVNYQWRGTLLIPDAYAPTNGTVQCFGTGADGGYTYLWLSPGASPDQINPAAPSASCPAGQVNFNGLCLAESPDVTAARGLDIPEYTQIDPVLVGNSASKEIVITNRGATFQNYSLQYYEYGAASAAVNDWSGGLRDFTVTADTCSGQAIAPGATCSFTLRWAPTLAGAGDLYVTLTSAEGLEQYGYVKATGTQGAVGTFELTFNPGQPGGGLVDVQGTVDGLSKWGELPESKAPDSTIVATFCPTDAAGKAALEQVDSATWLVSTRSGLSAYRTSLTDGTVCLAAWNPLATAGVHKLSFVTSAGTFNATMAVRPKIPVVNTATLTLSKSWDVRALKPLVSESSCWDYLSDVALYDADKGRLFSWNAVTGQPFALMDVSTQGFSLESAAEDANFHAWADIIDVSPNANFTRMDFTWQEGTPEDCRVASVDVTSGSSRYPAFKGDAMGFPGWPAQSTPGALRRLAALYNFSSLVAVTDDSQVYALARDCAAKPIAYPLGPVGSLAVTGYGYNSPPQAGLALFEWYLASAPATPTSRHLSSAVISPAAFIAGLASAGVSSSVAIRLPEAQYSSGNWSAAGLIDALTLYDDRTGELKSNAQFVPRTVASKADLTAAGITVLSAPPTVSCNCEFAGGATLLDGQSSWIQIGSGASCSMVYQKCVDGLPENLEFAACSGPPAPPVTPNGGTNGWGNWEPHAATDPYTCPAAEAGYCQYSAASTASVCPQWGFVASQGLYDGCIRRSCDSPYVNPAFIPGCD